MGQLVSDLPVSGQPDAPAQEVLFTASSWPQVAGAFAFDSAGSPILAAPSRISTQLTEKGQSGRPHT